MTWRLDPEADWLATSAAHLAYLVSAEADARRTDDVARQDSYGVSKAARAHALMDPASALAADAGLLRHLPPAAIAVTQEQWGSLLAEASLKTAMTELGQALAGVDAQSRAEGASIARDLRPAAVAFAGRARKVARMLWQIAAFAPTTPPRLAPPLAEFIDEMAVALERAGAWFESSEYWEMLERWGAFEVFPQSVGQMDALLAADAKSASTRKSNG